MKILSLIHIKEMKKFTWDITNKVKTLNNFDKYEKIIFIYGGSICNDKENNSESPP